MEVQCQHSRSSVSTVGLVSAQSVQCQHSLGQHSRSSVITVGLVSSQSVQCQYSWSSVSTVSSQSVQCQHSRASVITVGLVSVQLVQCQYSVITVGLEFYQTFLLVICMQPFLKQAYIYDLLVSSFHKSKREIGQIYIYIYMEALVLVTNKSLFTYLFTWEGKRMTN